MKYIPSLQRLGAYTLISTLPVSGILIGSSNFFPDLGFGVAIILTITLLVISGLAAWIFGRYAKKWDNSFVKFFRFLLGVACVWIGAYALSLCSVGIFFFVTAPRAEVVIPDGFKGKFAVLIKDITKQGWQTIGENYTYVIPAQGLLEVEQGWLGLSFHFKEGKMVPGKGGTLIRYASGQGLNHDEFDCNYLYKEALTQGIVCVVDSPEILKRYQNDRTLFQWP